jgi:hypothetical protein
MKKQLITLGALVGGFIIGASALIAVADTASTWSAPLHTPSTCLSGEPGCDAPINVGSVLQTKNGWLGVVGLITPNLNVASGTVSTPGSVLTNDGNGNARWSNINCASGQALQGISSTGNPICVVLSTGATVTNNYYNTSVVFNTVTNKRTCNSGGSNCTTIPTYGTTSWTVPSGVTQVKVDVWGGGGGGSYLHGNGGDAGVFKASTVTVVPGQILTIMVGDGGQPGLLYSSNCSSDISNGYRNGYGGFDSKVSFSGGQASIDGLAGGGGIATCSGIASYGASGATQDSFTAGSGGDVGSVGSSGEVVVFY